MANQRKKQPYYENAAELIGTVGHDEAQVFALLEKAHSEGDTRATYAVATWYLHGTYVAKDLGAAVRYLKESADGGIPDAMYDLAVCYEDGEGVQADPRVAFEYFLRAALHGESQSVFEVSRCYFWGIGVRKDLRVSAIWADRAEELGVYEEGA